MMSWTLPNGYVVQFNRPRKRGECKRKHRSHGFDGERTVCHDCGAVWRGGQWEANMQPPPARFLVLGRKPGKHGIRPIVCAGSLFEKESTGASEDRLEIDSGVMDEQLHEEVLHVVAMLHAVARWAT